MYKCTLLLLLTAAAQSVFCQDIRTPADMIKIIDKSPKTYSIEQLKDAVPEPDRSANIVYPGVYKKTEANGSFSVVPYNPNEVSKQLFDKAEAFFTNDDMDSALAYYQQSYNADTSFLQPLVYVGQVNGKLKRDEASMAAYRKVIAANPIDYMAHWFLSDILMRNNQKKEALKHIVRAHILNRNNQRLLVSLKYILEENDLAWNKWIFNPQYTLAGEGKNIQLAYEKPWLGYAIAKAVQQYEDTEPGNEKGKGRGDLLKQEKECLVSLLIALDAEKLSDKAPYKLITDALNKKLTDAFIIYEILLPQYPSIARQLPDELLNDIAGYLTSLKFVK